MADYYPLLAKAVAGLADATPDARRAIYERARQALFRQLRNFDPPLANEVIEREAQALEVGVARIETEIAARNLPADAAPLVHPDNDLTAPGRAQAASFPGGEPCEAMPREMDLPSHASAPPVSAAAGRTARAPRAPKFRRGPKGRGTSEAPAPEATPQGEASSSWVDGDEFPSDAPFTRPFEWDTPASEAPSLRQPEDAPEEGRTWIEAQRPFAPHPEREPGDTRRLIAAGGATGLVILLVAIAAYVLRDRPEDLVRLQPSSPAVQSEASGGAKIAERVSSGAPASGPPAASEGPAPAERSAGAAATGTGPANPPIPVARRAALLVEAPEEQSKVKTFLGTVVWRVENISGGPDEPLRSAVQAEINIPEEKIQATVAIQKNFDGTLPASHTVRLSFAVPPESPLGNIKQISALQMRREDTPTGEPLKGITVPITENSFLIGLAKGDAEGHNLDLLRSREWLDIPILLANGRIAKLTFEKGPSGQRAIEDAVASWHGQ